MDKTITQESYPNLDLFMPTEQASVMKLPPLSTSFVEQGTYSQKGSLRITLTKPWEELDDTLRLSMAEMKNSQPEYLFPKVNDTILNDWPANEKEERLDSEGGNYAKWRNLTLVAKSIHRFKTPIVERIKSAVNLRKNVNSWSPIRGEVNSAGKGIMYVTPGHIQNEALSDFREQADMFKSIERGSEKDIEFVVSCLKHDHRSNMYEADSVYRLANKPNHKGYTPLYVACKNGHLNLVKILLDFRANPYQICNIYPDTKESVLTVATRWGHFEIVRHLLGSKFFWPHRELKKAYEEAENPEIKSLLKNKMNVSKRSLFQRFLGPNDRERDS